MLGRNYKHSDISFFMTFYHGNKERDNHRTPSDRTQERKGIADMKDQKPVTYRIELKGYALLAAVKAGLIEKTDEGHDAAKFQDFWDSYQSMLLEKSSYNVCQGCGVFQKITEDEDYKRYKKCQYRDGILKAAIAFLFGFLFCFLIEIL